MVSAQASAEQAFAPLANTLGLVPMRVTTGDFAPYQRDSVAGFPPDEAARLFGLKAAVPVDDKGEPIEVTMMETEGEPKVLTSNAVKKQVEIAPDWKDQSSLKRIRLAKEIKNGDVANVDAADEIIHAELKRRGEP